jgi:hypothetical protein
LAVAVAAAPALATNVTFSLQGTTSALATRVVTVGPDAFGGVLLTTDTVTDVDMTAGLSNMITLPPTGGTVDVFAYAGTAGTGSTAGLMSFVANYMSTGPAPLTFSTFNFDTVYRDVPGRMASFSGFPSNIPDDRRMAGSRTSADGPWYQTWTGPFAASTGLAGASLTDVGAGSSALDTTSDMHTFGVGQRGNDGTGGETALGHFRVTVPGTPGAYTVTADDQSLLIYRPSPVFTSPPNPSMVVTEGQLRSSAPLRIVVTPEPSSLLLLLPAVALLRRRR